MPSRRQNTKIWQSNKSKYTYLSCNDPLLLAILRKYAVSTLHNTCTVNLITINNTENKTEEQIQGEEGSKVNII